MWFGIKAEKGQKTEAVWYAGKLTPRLCVGISKKVNCESTLQAFSYKSMMPVFANMSQKAGLCDDYLTLFKLLQTLGVCYIGSHKAKQGEKKKA